MSIASAQIAGTPIPSVTSQNARSGLAPATIAASSNEASIERNTADIRRNVSGTNPMPSIRIIPHIE